MSQASQETDGQAPVPVRGGGRSAVPGQQPDALELYTGPAGTALLATEFESGAITAWSLGAEQLYGWTAAEALGTSIFGHVPEERHAEVAYVRERLRRGEALPGWETDRRRKDGTVVRVAIDIAPIQDADGTVVGTVAVHRDLSGERRAEAALREAEARYRDLVERLPLTVYTLELQPERRLLYAAPQIEQLLGIPLVEVTLPRLTEMLHPDDRERTLAQLGIRASGPPGPLTLEYRIVRPDGAVVWLEDTSVVIETREAGVRHAQGYLLDISERRRLEEQLLQAQKMDAVGQLAGGIAHDFNNILTAIEGYSELALVRDDPEQMRADLGEIRKATARASLLTGQLLAFARRQVVRSRPLDVTDVIDETKNLILRLIGEHIEVESRLELPLGLVLADPTQVTQVLVNLAVNARDAMPGGGRLTISTANAVLDELAAEAAGVPAGAYVVLSVADTGAGMDAETARRAFEPFFTTKPVGAGSGLGLATVYGIARQGGGRAAIYSEPGHGTVVRVYLPRIEAVEPAAQQPEPVLETTGGNGTILLVEDDAVIRRLATEMLERQGYDVLGAADPAQALDLAAGAGAIDLLLTDVVMPVMNGAELARRLTDARPELRILFTSGYPADTIAGRGLVADDAPLLQKPFSGAELVAMVRDALS